MMDCKQATRLASEAQERRLSLRERLAWRLHLLMCAGCRRFARQMPLLRQWMRSHARRDDSPGD